jgi:hypothetical protein
MSPVAKLAGFAAVLALLFGIGALAGERVGADAPGGAAEAAEGMGGEDMGAMPVRGLAVAENGLRLVVENPERRRGATEQLRFRIVDEQNHAVRDFDVEHTKRMHLIVARRDLTGFQHLHPTMAADGTWSTPLHLTGPGSYRVFADFSHEEQATTLASDLRVDGPVDLADLPAPADTAISDGGYQVRLTAHEDDLRFTITRDGRPVRTEPYLGAGGHLVALREGDLAFLHVHPREHGEGEGIGFETTFPTAGRYRLFLQFRVDGEIQTVAFTKEVR